MPEKELGLQRLDVAESATVMSLFENVQREDLNPLEVAQDRPAILGREFKLTHQPDLNVG